MAMRARMRGQKTSYHHGDLKQGLMEAAATLIDIRGRHALTMREAARRAGVSEAAPYRHFANLDELLGAVAIEGYDMLADDIEAVSSAKAIRETYLAFAAGSSATGRRRRGESISWRTSPNSWNGQGGSPRCMGRRRSGWRGWTVDQPAFRSFAASSAK